MIQLAKMIVVGDPEEMENSELQDRARELVKRRMKELNQELQALCS
jgi:hypothetical protein